MAIIRNIGIQLEKDTLVANENIPVETEAERQAKLQAFIKTGAVERIAPNVTSASFKPLVEEVVEPKDFVSLHCNMKRFKVYTIVMSYRDVSKHIGFAHELYQQEENEVTGKQYVPMSQQWQRKLDDKRVKEAEMYLKTENHFFPSLVCVPSSVEGCVFHNGTVRIAKAGLLALDGQHRTAAIHDAMKDFPEEVQDEMVTITIIDIMNIETRRQVFADINRTPRKVAKALNLAFDNVDRAARLAKDAIIGYTVTVDETGAENVNGTFKNQPLRKLFDDEARPNPLAKSHNLMTLTGLYNLVKPLTEVTDEANGYVLTDSQLRETVEAVIQALPETDRLRRGTSTFDSIKKEYVFSTQTLWQGIGGILAEKLKAKNEQGTQKYDSAMFPQLTYKWLMKVTAAGNWKLAAKIWADPTKRVVTDGKKIGSQKGDVANAISILRDQMTD